MTHAAVAVFGRAAMPCAGRSLRLLILLGICGCAQVRRTSPPLPSHELSPQQVQDQLRQAVRDQPDDPALRVELAIADARVSGPASAESILRECWLRFPHYPRAPYQLGLLLLLAGREAESVAPLKAAAAIAPSDALTLQNAALACYRSGLVADARRYVAAALRADSRCAEPYLLLARIYDQQGTAESAMQYVRRYLERSPNPGPGYYMMGRLYSRQASRDSAEQWLRRSVDAEPANPEYWIALGRVYCELFGVSRAQEGVECYLKALAIDPSNAGAHQYLGQALLNERRFADAADHLRAAVQSSHEPGPLYYLLGQALLKAGREQEGRAALSRYQDFRDYTSGMYRLTRQIDHNPASRAPHYELIRLCLKYRQYRAARAALANASARIGEDGTLRGLADDIRANTALAPGRIRQPGTDMGMANER